LFDFFNFQNQLIKNQKRLAEFERKLSPQVVLERINDEPELEMNPYEPAPAALFAEITFKVEGEQRPLVKLETVDDLDVETHQAPTFDNFCNTTSDQDVFSENDRESSAHMETDEEVSSEVERKMNLAKKCKSGSKADSSKLKRERKRYKKTAKQQKKEKSALNKCTETTCEYLLHPKLISEHNNCFHAVSKEDTKVPEVIKPGHELCPYCAKVLLPNSVRYHVR
jgi:hypothetical protein